MQEAIRIFQFTFGLRSPEINLITLIGSFVVKILKMEMVISGVLVVKKFGPSAV